MYRAPLSSLYRFFHNNNPKQSIIIHYLYRMETIVFQFEDKLPFIFVHETLFHMNRAQN